MLGGIYGGIFTPTEAAVVAVFYSLFVAVVVYRSISFRDFIWILVDAGITSSVIMFIVVFAGIFTWATSVIGLVDNVASAIVSFSPNMTVMLILVGLMLLVLGMILDAISISFLILPILMPVLTNFNVDPLWFGVFLSLPWPSGRPPSCRSQSLHGCQSDPGDVDSIAKEAIPFIIVDALVLLIIVCFPFLSTWLPKIAGLYAP